MHICVAGRATRGGLVNPLFKHLEGNPEHVVSLALLGPKFSVDDFISCIQEAEIVIIFLEGTSDVPWLMAFVASGSGKYVLCLAPNKLTSTERELLAAMSKNISVIPRSSPEHIAEEVLPHFFERWGFRNPDQIPLAIAAPS
jgi:hypothetical protein